MLRDSDMQAATIGEPIEPGDGFPGLRRGDLVFWKGHVAIMTDAETMIHANGHTMTRRRAKALTRRSTASAISMAGRPGSAGR